MARCASASRFPRPSDTSEIRLIHQSDLSEEDVDRRSAVHGHFQMVWVHGYRFEEFLDEDASLMVGGSFPDALEVELLEGCEHILESPSEFRFGGDRLLDLCLFGSDGRDLLGEILFLDREQLTCDAVLVVELQEFASTFGQITECLRRALTVPARALAGAAPGPFQLSANGALEVSVRSHEAKPQERCSEEALA
jgi:hypothetical protein